MMQMLGFQGGGRSSPSSSSNEMDSSPRSFLPNPNSGPHYSSSPYPSGAVGPARPLRLVYTDDKGMFVMDSEALATLQLCKGPIGVVSVCGRARQGKSFILNQLLGRSSGFQVASTHRPCTKGLWMWSAPLKRTALDGTEYSLLLLDSEGIDAYDQTGTYSIQIFSLAVLLSSMFIYNQMGGIDEAALDRLSLVTEMTKHIRVRASGGRTTASELGQFSPVFVWLLRDFYLDLVEDNHKITPRDYLELALRPMQGGGKGVSAKNEIRESIRALFPDRECFTLVRPLNNENDLQRLDQISLDKLRPEFRAGLDALTKFVFERTRPKQVGATIMTGPVLVRVTQLFLDALNNGAVPTICSTWQCVEEAECCNAFDSATECYMSSFDRTKPPEEASLREAHEMAVQKSLYAFNANAVGAGSTRQKYEKLLEQFFRKAFEDYKKNAFLEADLQCATMIQSMDKKLQAACQVPDVKVDRVIQDLDHLCSEYETSSHGPAKWQKLAGFLQQCLDGPILDLFKKQLGENEAEKNALLLKFHSNEDRLGLLKKQLESNEKHTAEYMKRYDEAISDKHKVSEDFANHIANLQSKCSTLAERCTSLTKSLESVKNESSDWKLRYEHISLEKKAEDDKFKAEVALLKSTVTASEGSLAAAREQEQSGHLEALEWKQKYNTAAGEVKTALERAATAQECTIKKAQEREDALRAEFSVVLSEKEEELRELAAKNDFVDNQSSILISQLKAAESMSKNYEMETSALKDEIKALGEKMDSLNAAAQSHEGKARILEQEKNNLEEKYLSEFKKFEEADMRCKAAERDAKRATELADNAQAEAVAAQKEKSDFQHLALERLALIERYERQVDNLQGERVKLMEEIEMFCVSERDAVSKVALLEERVDEREREIECLLSQNNEQRSNTVQVLESLLATERAARADASSRAEALSLQLQSTQGKLDALQQELTSVRLNESALDSKLRTASHGKRSRLDDYVGVESGQDMDDEAMHRTGKKSKGTSSLTENNRTEDGGSSFGGKDNKNYNQENQEKEPEDHTKFTGLKLKQELTKHGFGAELLQLKNPYKKDLIALYEEHVLKN